MIERTIGFDRAHRKFGPMITVRHRTVLGRPASNQHPRLLSIDRPQDERSPVAAVDGSDR